MQQSLRLISLSNYVFVLEISQISGIMQNVRMLIKNFKAVALFQLGPCWLSIGVHLVMDFLWVYNPRYSVTLLDLL